MIITEYFKNTPPPEIVKEFPLGSGIEYIGIKDIKAMLDKDFYRWGTSNFQCSLVHHGHETYLISSVELDLEFVVFPFPNDTDPKKLTEIYKFVGTSTFNIKTQQPEGDVNDNFSAVGLANAIKNAAKNIGVAYGKNLNHPESYCPNYETTQEKQKDNTTRKAITNILNSQSKKTN